LTIFIERVEKLKKIGKKAGIDAFLVNSGRNMRYFAGFSALAIERFAGVIIPVETGAPVVLVPRLEEEKAKEYFEFEEIKSYDDSENPATLLSQIVKELTLEKAVFVPDVVLFVGTPLQISRIIFLDAFETGEIDTVHGEPLCSGVIAVPITTGKIGISFLDIACRAFGRYKPEEMVAGVPYQRLTRMVASLDRSIAGTAQPNFLLKLLPRVMNFVK